ncbi:MAG: hypothetical protein EP343_18255 [Deltaproteobacteria bacterium]|nr:MAG: hypothetical protein EP343_18255 [Deltaproteobacteria bacterium]
MTEKKTPLPSTSKEQRGEYKTSQRFALVALLGTFTFTILLGFLQPGLLTGRSTGGEQAMGCGGGAPPVEQNTPTLGQKKQALNYACNPPCAYSQVCAEQRNGSNVTYVCDDDGCLPNCGANETCQTVTVDVPGGPSEPRRQCVACDKTICTDAQGRKLCVDTNTDLNHCGACSTARPSPNYYCNNGKYTLCRDSICMTRTFKDTNGSFQVAESFQCVDRLFDPEHCGSCGKKCTEGKVCHLGRCVDTCGDTFCGTQCTSLLTDRNNCGACGQSCASGQVCDNGTCQACAHTICGHECADLQTNPEHCGSCGNVCDEGSTCSSGQCQPACSRSACNNTCVNTNDNIAHCGGCGIKCLAGQVCKGGNCIGEHVVLPICEEFQNAVKIAHIAYDRNVNKASKLAALPSGNFQLVKTYHNDESNFTHAYISRGTYDNKHLCYIAFRGTRSQVHDQVYYLIRLATGRTKCRTTNGVRFASAWSHLYDCYQGARGTNLLDLSTNQFKTHDDTLLPNRTRLVADVLKLVKGGHCSGGIRIVGHSVGGAVASLHAAELYTQEPNLFTKSFMKVITFGEPRVMKKEDADYYHSRIVKYRISNKNDIIPSFPDSKKGYYHWGATKKIKSGGSSIVDEKQNWSRSWRLNKEAHSKDTYLRRIGHCDCSDSGAGSGCQSATAGNTCLSGTSLCGNTCRNLQVDEDNCGSCGNKCPSGKICISGACTCEPGQTFCSGVCQDLQNDPTNCGSCGNQCASGQQCCGGQCTDTTQSASNCGVCGKVCGSGESCCNGKCSATQSDERNCGACGTVCGNSETCCSGSCKDVSSDHDNCGTCGNSCGSIKTCCNHLCVLSSSTIKHCGVCSKACEEGIDCETGKCNCGPGKTDCNGTCAVLNKNVNHCGACGISCGPGSCNNGTCSCPAGTFKNTSGGCTPCSAGTYQDQAGQTSCIACPTGRYQDQTGQTSCNKCPAGTKNSNTGSTSSSSCIACPVGTYQDQTGAHWCKSCGKGKYNPNTGSTSASACLPCAAGSYNGGYAKASCKACPIGTFNPNTGSQEASACQACPTGRFQDETGQASCKACPAGTKNSNTGSISPTACIICPKGTYQNLTGAHWCKACGKGKYNPNTGSTSSSACLPCSKGSYNDGYAKASCTTCPRGTTTCSTGATSSSACVPVCTQ